MDLSSLPPPSSFCPRTHAGRAQKLPITPPPNEMLPLPPPPSSRGHASMMFTLRDPARMRGSTVPNGGNLAHEIYDDGEGGPMIHVSADADVTCWSTPTVAAAIATKLRLPYSEVRAFGSAWPWAPARRDPNGLPRRQSPFNSFPLRARRRRTRRRTYADDGGTTDRWSEEFLYIT